MRAFMKNMLPPIIILVVALFLIQIPETESVSRINGLGASLVACVMYHSNLEIQANSTGRFTTADLFMVVIYVLLMVSILVDVILLKLKAKERSKHLFLLGRSWAMVCVKLIKDYANIKNRLCGSWLQYYSDLYSSRCTTACRYLP